MSKFKVGDRVERNNVGSTVTGAPRGQKGIVVSIVDSTRIGIKLDPSEFVHKRPMYLDNIDNWSLLPKNSMEQLKQLLGEVL